MIVYTSNDVGKEEINGEIKQNSDFMTLIEKGRYGGWSSGENRKNSVA